MTVVLVGKGMGQDSAGGAEARQNKDRQERR